MYTDVSYYAGRFKFVFNNMIMINRKFQLVDLHLKKTYELKLLLFWLTITITKPLFNKLKPF